MKVLIPMAGAGSRFQQEGYKDPKPLIEVNGKPMVISAVESLPKSDQQVFICRDFHIKDYGIDKVLKQYYPKAQVISVTELTEGQACTCLLAKDLINNNDELLIAASDNGMIYDHEAFEKAKQGYDAIVFSFRNNVTVVPKPEQYGWLEVEGEYDIKRASVKVPVSQDPIHDHAIVGAFWFREGRYFVEAAEAMIEADRRINGEFYVDEAVNNLIELGYKARVFEIDYYICWGTPDDLRTYEYWQGYFTEAK